MRTICIALLVSLLMVTGNVYAHPHHGRLAEPDYNRIMTLAHELEERSEHAADQFREKEGRWYDRDLIDAADHFADQARHFHHHVESYYANPWDIDAEARHLMSDAREVDEQISRVGLRKGHSYRDWDRVLEILDNISQVYADSRSEEPEHWRGRYHSWHDE